MSLDFSKPYGEVHGLPGAFYEQSGAYYKADGAPAIHIQEYIEELPVIDDSVPPPVCCYEQPTAPAEVAHDDSINGMPNKHLKALIESYGGEWTGRKAALEFMKGK